MATSKTETETTLVFRGPVITVEVGPEPLKYYIHKALLLKHSGFFRGALSNPAFRSAEDGIVKLEDVDPAVFDVFAHYLYYGTIGGIIEWDKLYPHAAEYRGLVSKDGVKVTRMYVLADQLLADDFKKECLEKAISIFIGSHPSYALITYAWDNLPAHDVLLEVFLDSHCYFRASRRRNESNGMGELLEDKDALPREFLYRIIQKWEDTAEGRLGMVFRSQKEFMKLSETKAE